MLALLSAIFGFAAPFFPEVFKLFQRSQDNKHELAMLEMRSKMAGQEHLYRMEEITAAADIAEAKEIHKPTPSFGVQILDKAQATLPKWVWVPVFWAFSFLDWFAGMVRPGVTWAVVGGYLAYKLALFRVLIGPRFENTWEGAATQVWAEQDFAILALCLSYYFGVRSYKAVFGGNASHGEKGK